MSEVPVVPQTAPWPRRSEAPGNYSSMADAVGVTLPTTIDGMNEAVDFINQRAVDADTRATDSANSASAAAQAKSDAELARDAAQNVANFKGSWSSLAGAISVPATVLHNDQIWSLLANLADVAASEPGVSADWVVQGGIDASKTVNFTASRNAAYWIGSSLTVTLPDATTPPPKGTFVRLTKALTAKPVIQAGAGSAVIATSKGNDTSVTFDVNAEIIFIFNGTNWEV